MSSPGLRLGVESLHMVPSSGGDKRLGGSGVQSIRRATTAKRGTAAGPLSMRIGLGSEGFIMKSDNSHRCCLVKPGRDAKKSRSTPISAPVPPLDTGLGQGQPAK